VLAAARYLQEWLPLYGHLEDYGLDEAPPCVDQVDDGLVELVPFLAQQVLDRGSGDGRRVVRASVCVEAYRLIHGSVPIHSADLRQACETLWLACGNTTTQSAKGAALGADVRDNWRRFLERVRDGDDWVRSRLELYKLDPKRI
jgi:hypothetical protein